MRLRPFLMLVRGRLIFVSIGSMVVVLATFSFTSAEGLTDFGIFWHHYCGCPPDPTDLRFLFFSLTLICLYLGVALGVVTGLGLSFGGMGAAGQNPGGGPIAIGDTRFLLTRPTQRSTILFRPFVIAAIAIAVIPALSYLLLLAWLRLVHAPALVHLADDMALIPAVAALGAHPSLPKILTASHFWSFYAGAISVGFCAYALMAAQRWLVLSGNKWLRRLAILPVVLPVFSPLLFMALGLEKRNSVGLALLQWPPRGVLDFHPSTLNISLHFAFAAAVLCGCWSLLRKIDI
jgi:hypothetical protein